MDPDGSADHVTIQQAIDAARDGDWVQVRAGVYRENLVVNRTVTLRGGGTGSTVIDGGEIGSVLTITADRVTVSGFHIRNSSKSTGHAGILITSHGNRIEDVVCSHNRNGIYPRESSGNLFVNVVCQYNTLHGMTFGYSGSDGNEIRDSIFRHNGHEEGLNGNGIHMQEARGTIIHSSGFMDNSNFGLYVNECSEILLSGSTFSRNRDGLMVSGSDTVRVEYCHLAENADDGMRLDGSTNCQIVGVSVTANRDGIAIPGDVEGLLIRESSIRDNREMGVNVTGVLTAVDARWNWWGNGSGNGSGDGGNGSGNGSGITSGPFHPEANPNGTGDRVSHSVWFAPWLGVAPATDRPAALFVHAGAPGDGVGTESHPFRSIRMALFWAREGDRVTVRPGVYRENLVVEKAVILSGDGPASTVIDGGGIVDVVTLSADHVTISGFHIRNGSRSPGYAGILVESHGNRIEDVVCSHNRNGIYLRESSGNLITGVVCENNTLHGMTFGASGSDRNEIRDSIFRYNGQDGLNGNGIHMQGARGSILRTSGFTGNRYLGLYVNECSDIVLYSSTFSGNRYGLNLRGSDRITVGWCDVTDHDGYGIALDNSVFCQILGGSMARNVVGVWIEGDVRDIRIHQNTIRNNRESGVSATAASAGVDARWNWWGSDTGPFHHLLNPGGTGDRVTDHVVFEPWLNTPWDVTPPQDPPPAGDDGAIPLVRTLLLGILTVVGLMLAILGFAVAKKDRPLRGPMPMGSRWHGRSMAEGGRSDTRGAGSHTGRVLSGRRTDGAGTGEPREGGGGGGQGSTGVRAGPGQYVQEPDRIRRGVMDPGDRVRRVDGRPGRRGGGAGPLGVRPGGDVRDPQEIRASLGILGPHLRGIGRRLGPGGTGRGNPRGIPPWHILRLKQIQRGFTIRRGRDLPAKPKPQKVGRDTGMGKKDARLPWKEGKPGSDGRMDHPYRDAIQSETRRK